MKGIVFTEFLDMVESKFGLETADAVITSSGIGNGGGYTSVGTYDHADLLALVAALSEHENTAPAVLVRTFGEHLFDVFSSAYPQYFDAYSNAFDFLRSLDGVIHVEVRKLYPDAELPAFHCFSQGPHHLAMIYRSSRPFADLAEGLIAATFRRFHPDEPLELRRAEIEDEHGTGTRFDLQLRGALTCQT